MSHWKEFTKGLWERNPQLVVGVALCTTLATSTSLSNALWMTIAAICTLTGTGLIVSLLGRIMQPRVRLPIIMAVSVTLVTAVGFVIRAYQPEAYRSLGIYLPLIAVNCIILNRADQFARNNGVTAALLDGLGMGIGFGITLAVLAIVREFLGANAFFGRTVIPGFDQPRVMLLAPGAFIILGLMLWGMNSIRARGRKK